MLRSVKTNGPNKTRYYLDMKNMDNSATLFGHYALRYKGMWKCFTHDALSEVPPGWNNRVQILLNLPYGDDIDNVFYLYVHNKGQMIFPKNDLIYGSTFLYKSIKQGNNYWQPFAITRTQWKTLDRPDKRCDVDNQSEANTTMCITRYIERTTGCSIGLSGSDPEAERCNETNQIEEYKNIINKLYPANSNQIYNMTGCLSKCDRYSYAIKPTTDLTRPTWNKNNDSIALWLYVSTGETEVREQYIEYDWNALVADVGGYLGLLLGHSVYSLFVMSTEWVKTKRGL